VLLQGRTRWQQGVLNVKTSVLSATFVASVLVALFGYIFAQAQVTQPATNSRPAAGTSVAVIDIGSIFRNHQRFKKYMDDIKKDFDDFEGYARQQQDVIKQKTDQLKTLPPGSPEYRTMEEQIAEMHTKLRLDIGRKQKERVEQEAKVYFNAYREIELEVNRFADRYGIDLVLRFSSDDMDPAKPESILQGINRFVVLQRNLNITNHVLDELNRKSPPSEMSRQQPPQIPGRDVKTR
jgi:Skp family chaperone for outer membrane proteins